MNAAVRFFLCGFIDAYRCDNDKEINDAFR